jgi:Putative enzyme of poly-gamma-glutamate biosynthesis (capsule formation)
MKKLRIAAVLFLALLFTSCQSTYPAVTIALLGDLMIGRGTDPKPDSLAILTPYLSSSDLVLANLESPLTSEPPVQSSAYNLCTSSSRANLLASWGFDLLSIANNHQYDCGPEGPSATRSALESVGITPIGSGMDPVRRVVNGLLLAFLAFDDVSSTLDVNSAIQEIRSERATGALVIVSVHWGMEYQGGVSDHQKSLAEQFVNAGAVLVWGHHPHVLQPVEWIETARGKALILFSLGNTLFDQVGLSDTRQSALVVITLNAQGVTKVRAVPFVIDVVESRLLVPDAETVKQIQDNIQIP